MNFGIQFSAAGMNRGEISEYSSFDELSRVFGIFLIPLDPYRLEIIPLNFSFVET
jgi:hypothetical protein